jgi:hypothetical protein
VVGQGEWSDTGLAESIAVPILLEVSAEGKYIRPIIRQVYWKRAGRKDERDQPFFCQLAGHAVAGKVLFSQSVH